MTVLLVVLVGAACWTYMTPGAGLRRLGVRRQGVAGLTVAHPGGPVVVALGVTGTALVLLVGGVAGVGLTAGAAGAAALVARIVRAGRLRSHRRRRRRDVLEFCDAFAAELRGGLPVAAAVERSCAGFPELSAVARAARFGAEPARALGEAARVPGAEGLRAVAVAWEVAATSGAALAEVLDRVGAALRAEEDARAEVEAALAPPRATAKLLAVLPAFGVLLGMSMGAQPLQFLLGTGVGVMCLGAGLVLALAGVVWVERIATTAET